MLAGAVGFLAKTQLRSRWRSLALLAVLLGAAGGTSLSLIAGARRSATVVDRFFATARHYDTSVYDPSGALGEGRLLALPEVRRADPNAYAAFMFVDSNGGATAGINSNAFDWSSRDPTRRMLEGTFPATTDPAGVVVNRTFVEQFHESVGDTVTVRAFGLEQRDQVNNGIYRATGPTFRFRITGVIRNPDDIGLDETRALGQGAYRHPNEMMINNAFYEAHRTQFLTFGTSFNIQLAHGARDVPAFTRAVTRGANAQLSLLVAPVEDQTHRESLDTPVQLETTALLALGIGLAIMTAIVLALALRAEQRVHDADAPMLRAMGFSSARLATSALLRSLPTAVTGTILAFAVAVVLSPRAPIGIGRELELDRGVQVNVAVLALGALSAFVFVAGLAALFGRSRLARSAAPKPSTLASRLASTGAPVEASVAAHLAFGRTRGTRSIPSRPAIGGGAILLAIVVGLGVYVGGVNHAYASPAAHGWRWDAAIGNVNFPMSRATAVALTQDRSLRALTRVGFGQATVDRQSAEFLAFDRHGTAPPAVSKGRLPRSGSEVALGEGLIRSLRAPIGSTVRFTVKDGEFDTGKPTHTLTLTVVGEALSPVFGESDVSNIGMVPLETIAAAGGNAEPRIALVRLGGHVDDRARAALDRRYTEEITLDTVPAQVVNLHRVVDVPELGMLFAALMAIIVVLYAMVFATRARTRDLAVLRAIGLSVRGVRRVLTWESVILVVGALAIGLPAGILAGGALWRRVADPIGLGDGTVDAFLPLGVVVGALAVAWLVAQVPARRARRLTVAATLRTD